MDNLKDKNDLTKKDIFENIFISSKRSPKLTETDRGILKF